MTCNYERSFLLLLLSIAFLLTSFSILFAYMQSPITWYLITCTINNSEKSDVCSIYIYNCLTIHYNLCVWPSFRKGPTHRQRVPISYWWKGWHLKAIRTSLGCANLWGTCWSRAWGPPCPWTRRRCQTRTMTSATRYQSYSTCRWYY